MVLGRKGELIIDMKAPNPPRPKDACHQQRDAARFSSPAVEEVAHDFRSVSVLSSARRLTDRIP